MLPDAHNTKRNNESLQSVERTIQHARCTLTYTHATLLLEEGIEREVVQKRLGHASRASSYFLLKQDERAIEDYNQAIKIDPNDGYAYYWRGQAHSQLGNSAQSAKDLAKAEELGYEPD